MRKFHIALGVKSVTDSIADYTQRLSARPHVIVPEEYALWRTETLNVSIRQIAPGETPGLRHLGWEDSALSRFTETLDCNGILWEEFSAELQLQEIIALWPNATQGE
jgi:hypothetical protein